MFKHFKPISIIKRNINAGISLNNKYNDSCFENFHVRDKLIVQLSFPMKEHMMLYLVDHSEQSWFPKWTIRQRYEKILFLPGIGNQIYRLNSRNWNHFSTSFQLVFHQWKFLFRRDWKGCYFWALSRPKWKFSVIETDLVRYWFG